MSTAADWSGALGAKWAASVASSDLLLDNTWRGALHALKIQPGWHVIDLGCGAGTTTREIAARVGSAGRVTAADISPDLTNVARSRVAGHPVDIVCADAATHAFSPGAADALFSRFGCMFFDDQPAAWANLRLALKPGAPIRLVVWARPADNLWAALPRWIVDDLIGPDPDPSPVGPFAWADVDPWLDMLREAGFADVSATHRATTATLSAGDDPDPVARAVTMAIENGPSGRRLREAGDAMVATARLRIADAFRVHVTDGAIVVPAATWIIAARAA